MDFNKFFLFLEWKHLFSFAFLLHYRDSLILRYAISLAIIKDRGVVPQYIHVYI